MNFTWTAALRPETVKYLARVLINERRSTSFAVITEKRDGTWDLWLSDTSYALLLSTKHPNRFTGELQAFAERLAQ